METGELSHKWQRCNWYSYRKKEIGLLSHTSYKNQFQMDYNLNVKGKTLELFKDNVGEYLHDLGATGNCLRPNKH